MRVRYGLILWIIAEGLREFQWIALKFTCREIQWDSLNAAELPGTLRYGWGWHLLDGSERNR